jgi:hypothetical protein
MVKSFTGLVDDFNLQASTQRKVILFKFVCAKGLATKAAKISVDANVAIGFTAHIADEVQLSKTSAKHYNLKSSVDGTVFGNRNRSNGMAYEIVGYTDVKWVALQRLKAKLLLEQVATAASINDVLGIEF